MFSVVGYAATLAIDHLRFDDMRLDDLDVEAQRLLTVPATLPIGSQRQQGVALVVVVPNALDQIWGDIQQTHSAFAPNTGICTCHSSIRMGSVLETKSPKGFAFGHWLLAHLSKTRVWTRASMSVHECSVMT